MTQEEKELLLKELSARLPYHCRVFYEYVDNLDNKTYGYSLTLNTWCIDEFDAGKAVVKPYLLPMSSMTEEEKEELSHLLPKDWSVEIDKLNNFYFDISPSIFMEIDVFLNIIDWLNAHHFDYRGLIEKGLALKAKEGMYDVKER